MYTPFLKYKPLFSIVCSCPLSPWISLFAYPEIVLRTWIKASWKLVASVAWMAFAEDRSKMRAQSTVPMVAFPMPIPFYSWSSLTDAHCCSRLSLSMYVEYRIVIWSLTIECSLSMLVGRKAMVSEPHMYATQWAKRRSNSLNLSSQAVQGGWPQLPSQDPSTLQKPSACHSSFGWHSLALTRCFVHIQIQLWSMYILHLCMIPT